MGFSTNYAFSFFPSSALDTKSQNIQTGNVETKQHNVSYNFNLDTQFVRKSNVLEVGNYPPGFYCSASFNFLYLNISFTDRNESKFTTLNETIVWLGGTTTPVTGKPSCGWDGEYCRSGLYNLYYIS